MDDEPMEEEPQTTEDFEEYTLDTETGLCEAKDYVEAAAGVYQSNFGGGTWVMNESNGVPGLQYEDNHPLSGTGVGFELAVDSRCVGGDQVVA